MRLTLGRSRWPSAASADASSPSMKAVPLVEVHLRPGRGPRPGSGPRHPSARRGRPARPPPSAAGHRRGAGPASRKEREQHSRMRAAPDIRGGPSRRSSDRPSRWRGPSCRGTSGGSRSTFSPWALPLYRSRPVVEHEDVLEGDHVTLHPLDLGDVGDPAGAVLEPSWWTIRSTQRRPARGSPASAGPCRPSAPWSRCGPGCRADCWRARCRSSRHDRCSWPGACRAPRRHGPHRR